MTDAMFRSFSCAGDGELLDGVESRPSGPESPSAVVLLHGAGTSDKARLTGLMADFSARGHRALAFDFSGHGSSSGTLPELSLRRRFTQAETVIGRQVPAGHDLVLIGFSMSGQTVADLARHYGRRVTAIGLCAPAVYARRAWSVRFDAGFTDIIRTPDSWRDSTALDTFRTFPARAVLAVPAVDAVIPPAVTGAVAEALAARSCFTHLTFPDADHQLALWFRDHAGHRRRFVDAVLASREDPVSGDADGVRAAPPGRRSAPPG
ncbi:alpha/beta hydrolase [Streptomyces sp. bgisy100]|uniref:alpha/beta hydrolase n=1 Tax=Streptomyces sp. bgisy100 TaxID=3413783 RepID=UPI003D7182AC